MSRAAIVGAGFGGLALGIRLQNAGVATTIFEARDKPGGRAYAWEKDGHVFDAGPTVITDPACLAELWALSGADMADDIELVPVTPFYRLSWPDGTEFDYSNDDAAIAAQIARLELADVEGYRRFLGFSEGAWREGYLKLGAKPFLRIADMARALPQLLRFQAWRSVYSVVSSFVRSRHLREALSFHTLLVGGNPMSTSAIYALIHKLERDGGVWFARGGTGKLIAAMAAHFEKVGGTIRLSAQVEAIESEACRVTAIRTANGRRESFDAIACNGDVVHSYGLVQGHKRGPAMVRRLKRKRYSPSLFVVHLGARGHWPDVPHHNILFGPRYRGLLDDIYRAGRLPSDPALYVHHPTASDAGMAPADRSTFYVLAPVPHLGKGDIDWDVAAPALRDRMISILEERLLPGLRGRIETVFHYGPADFARDLAAHLGSAFSLEPTLMQSAWFRVHNRDAVIPNLYFVGAGTHPGAGIPGVVASAKATAGLMIADLAR